MSAAFAYLASAELSDVGRRRKNNEDSLIRIPGAGVFCVADGMGGVQGGEVASKACVDALGREFTQSPEAPFSVTADASAKLVERALNTASLWIKERAESLGLVGTGSTAVVLVFDRVTPSQGIALHAGDSRAYRLREDKLVQLTTDHSVAAAAGLPDDSSLPSMFRGVITRAVGLARQVELEATPFDLAPNDLFLLCSDGLSKMVSDRRIQKLMRKHQQDPLETLARTLVDEALREGGEDNVSVVVIRVAPDLPRGPTMEIPPETLALEQLVLAPPPAPQGERHHGEDDHDATGRTAETGTHTASTMADAGPNAEPARLAGITPVTPDSGGKPATPATPLTPAADKTAPPAPVPTPFRGSEGLRPGRHGLVWLFLALVVILAVAAWWLSQRPGDWRKLISTPVSGKAVPAPAADSQHGMPE